jgi:putative membrane protein
MLFTDPDRTRIAGAIAEAEAHTAGEIVVIISTAVHRYRSTALSLAALVALAAPMLALFLGWSPATLFPDWDAAASPALRERHGLEVLLLVQALVFVLTLALALFSGLDRQLTPRGLRRDRVHAAALTQFKARGLEATQGRTGVLIYIDEPDHIAEIIADSGIYSKVPPEYWGDTIAALTGGIKAGKAADGMVKAIGLAGKVLAEHIPPHPRNDNELPDHLIEI